MDFLVTSKHVSKIFPKSNGQFSSTPQDKYRIPVIEFPLGFDDSCGLTTSVDLGERRSLRMVSQVAGVPILQWRPYGSMMIHVASNSNSLEFHAELCAIPHAFYGWRWAFFLGRSSKATLRWSQQLSACPDCAVQGHLVCLLCTS